MTEYDVHFEGLNAPCSSQRLEHLREIIRLVKAGEVKLAEPTGHVNNHIHTIYSFSPYSPTKAVWCARQSGLLTAGITDHDSVSGAAEFIEAGKIAGVATTVAMELRCSAKGTELEGKRINNPDQKSCAYVAIHGIPHQKLEEVDAFIAPYRKARGMRNRKMLANLNKVLAPAGIFLDYDRDVLPISMDAEGGGVTERHLLFAAVNKITAKFPKGKAVTDYLKNTLGLKLSAKAETQLSDSSNAYYDYDLLGVLKGELVERFYVDADEECPHITEVPEFAAKIGAVSAYAYLGDVGDSLTGDKRAQKFEDDYLDELIPLLAKWGFNAVTYMPSRNTMVQLKRIMALCDKNGLFQISGEDINSPRQTFTCDAILKPEFSHLITATWALIGTEQEASEKLENAMFGERMKALYPDVNERARFFAELAEKSYEKRVFEMNLK